MPKIPTDRPLFTVGSPALPPDKDRSVPEGALPSTQETSFPEENLDVARRAAETLKGKDLSAFELGRSFLLASEPSVGKSSVPPLSSSSGQLRAPRSRPSESRARLNPVSTLADEILSMKGKVIHDVLDQLEEEGKLGEFMLRLERTHLGLDEEDEAKAVKELSRLLRKFRLFCGSYESQVQAWNCAAEFLHQEGYRINAENPYAENLSLSHVLLKKEAQGIAFLGLFYLLGDSIGLRANPVRFTSPNGVTDYVFTIVDEGSAEEDVGQNFDPIAELALLSGSFEGADLPDDPAAQEEMGTSVAWLSHVLTGFSLDATLAGAFDEGSSFSKAALRLNPNGFTERANMANVALYQGTLYRLHSPKAAESSLRNAERIIKRLIADDPSLTAFHCLLGDLYVTGRYDLQTALRHYNKADPQDWNAIHARMTVHLIRGETREFNKLLESNEELEDIVPLVYANAAYYFLGRGHFNKARLLIERAASEAPNDSKVLYGRAMLFWHEGKMKACEEACEHLLKLYPTHEPAYLLLKRTQFKLQGQKPKSKSVAVDESSKKTERRLEVVRDPKDSGVIRLRPKTPPAEMRRYASSSSAESLELKEALLAAESLAIVQKSLKEAIAAALRSYSKQGLPMPLIDASGMEREPKSRNRWESLHQRETTIHAGTAEDPVMFGWVKDASHPSEVLPMHLGPDLVYFHPVFDNHSFDRARYAMAHQELRRALGVETVPESAPAWVIGRVPFEEGAMARHPGLRPWSETRRHFGIITLAASGQRLSESAYELNDTSRFNLTGFAFLAGHWDGTTNNIVVDRNGDGKLIDDDTSFSRDLIHLGRWTTRTVGTLLPSQYTFSFKTAVDALDGQNLSRLYVRLQRHLTPEEIKAFLFRLEVMRQDLKLRGELAVSRPAKKGSLRLRPEGTAEMRLRPKGDILIGKTSALSLDYLEGVFGHDPDEEETPYLIYARQRILRSHGTFVSYVLKDASDDSVPSNIKCGMGIPFSSKELVELARNAGVDEKRLLDAWAWDLALKMNEEYPLPSSLQGYIKRLAVMVRWGYFRWYGGTVIRFRELGDAPLKFIRTGHFPQANVGGLTQKAFYSKLEKVISGDHVEWKALAWLWIQRAIETQRDWGDSPDATSNPLQLLVEELRNIVTDHYGGDIPHSSDNFYFPNRDALCLLVEKGEWPAYAQRHRGQYNLIFKRHLKEFLMKHGLKTERAESLVEDGAFVAIKKMNGWDKSVPGLHADIQEVLDAVRYYVVRHHGGELFVTGPHALIGNYKPVRQFIHTGKWPDYSWNEESRPHSKFDRMLATLLKAQGLTDDQAARLVSQAMRRAILIQKGWDQPVSGLEPPVQQLLEALRFVIATKYQGFSRSRVFSALSKIPHFIETGAWPVYARQCEGKFNREFMETIAIFLTNHGISKDEAPSMTRAAGHAAIMRIKGWDKPMSDIPPEVQKVLGAVRKIIAGYGGQLAIHGKNAVLSERSRIPEFAETGRWIVYAHPIKKKKLEQLFRNDVTAFLTRHGYSVEEASRLVMEAAQSMGQEMEVVESGRQGLENRMAEIVVGKTPLAEARSRRPTRASHLMPSQMPISGPKDSRGHNRFYFALSTYGRLNDLKFIPAKGRHLVALSLQQPDSVREQAASIEPAVVIRLRELSFDADMKRGDTVAVRKALALLTLIAENSPDEDVIRSAVDGIYHRAIITGSVRSAAAEDGKAIKEVTSCESAILLLIRLWVGGRAEKSLYELPLKVLIKDSLEASGVSFLRDVLITIGDNMVSGFTSSALRAAILLDHLITDCLPSLGKKQFLKIKEEWGEEILLRISSIWNQLKYQDRAGRGSPDAGPLQGILRMMGPHMKKLCRSLEIKPGINQKTKSKANGVASSPGGESSPSVPKGAVGWVSEYSGRGRRPTNHSLLTVGDGGGALLAEPVKGLDPHPLKVVMLFLQQAHRADLIRAIRGMSSSQLKRIMPLLMRAAKARDVSGIQKVIMPQRSTQSLGSSIFSPISPPLKNASIMRSIVMR